tara:strand:- start:26440 stop:30834 length:4395 start_codon:yes stop_codon:yes gene_type:complete
MLGSRAWCLESLKTSVLKRGSAASGSRQRRRRSDFKSGSEALESRTLLSGTGLTVQTGDDGPNILIAAQGPSNSDILTGLGGDDTLVSDGGLDELSGGDGDDRLVVVAAPFGNTHGGPGNDVLEFRIAGNFDLTKLSTGDVQGIEVIDLADTRQLVKSTLTLNPNTVSRLNPDTRTLRILRTPDDTVTLEGEWQLVAADFADGRFFAQYTAESDTGSVTVELESSWLAHLDDDAGYHINAPGTDTGQFGSEVQSIGDWNRDGIDDFAIASHTYGMPARVYVVFGSATDFGGHRDLNSGLDGTNGFLVQGESPAQFSGPEIDASHDVNGDGIPDLQFFSEISAPGNVGEQITIVYGRADGMYPATLSATDFDGTDGTIVTGPEGSQTSTLTRSLFTIPDINGDGIDDLYSGSIRHRSSTSAFIAFGNDAGIGDRVSMDDLFLLPGVRLQNSGDSGRFYIEAVDVADTNGDGLPDLIVTGTGYDFETQPYERGHEVRVVLGQQPAESGGSFFPEVVDLDELDGSRGFVIRPEVKESVLDGFYQQELFAGPVVIHDVNGDSVDDLLFVTGDSFVWFYGSDQPFDSVELLSVADTIELVSVQDLVRSGANLGADFNSDGLLDIATSYNVGLTIQSASQGLTPYDALLDRWSFLPELIEPFDGANPSDNPNFVRTGVGTELPFPLNARNNNSGDFNGDGFDDLIVSQSSNGIIQRYDNGSRVVTVVFGGPDFAGLENSDVTYSIGDEGDDELFASAGSDRADALIGAQGDDTLISDGGEDVLKGAAGDDLLRVIDHQFRVADGGGGFDTLQIMQAGVDLDLTSPSDHRLRNLEVLSLVNNGPNTLTIDSSAVVRMTSSENRLRIDRDSSDVIEMGDGWTNVGISVAGGQRFEVWQNGPAVVDLEILPPESPFPSFGIVSFDGGDDDYDQVFTLSFDQINSEMVLQITGGPSGPREERVHAAFTQDGIRLDMGGGNDRLVLETTGFDVTVSGGDGNDSVVVFGRDDADEMQLKSAASIDRPGSRDWLDLSTVFDDVGERDFLLADGIEDVQFELLGGDDLVTIESFARHNTELATLTVNLGSGNDRLEATAFDLGLTADGGSGHDILVTGAGDDSISGGTGRDTVNAGAGNDLLYGKSQDDSLNGEAGDDTLVGDSGNDHLNGGVGDDSILGLNGDDEIHGHDGDDIVNTGNGADSVYGGDGADWMIGHVASHDWFDGGEGNDTIGGLGGHDTLNGSGGNDSLLGASGHDWLDGGDGDDLLFGDLGDSAAVNKGNDTLYGGAGNDDLAGGRLADELHGGDGDDTLRGDNDNDVLYGDGGRDMLMGLNGDDVIYGGDGDDTLKGGKNQDTLYGDAGHDFLEGHSRGNEELNGGEGNDTLRGLGGNDTLRGDDGDDSLEGHAGNDVIDGGTGDDMLDAGSDDDTLTGGSGRDTMMGGTGIDRFFADDGEIDILEDMLDEDSLSLRDDSDTVS